MGESSNTAGEVEETIRFAPKSNEVMCRRHPGKGVQRGASHPHRPHEHSDSAGGGRDPAPARFNSEHSDCPRFSKAEGPPRAPAPPGAGAQTPARGVGVGKEGIPPGALVPAGAASTLPGPERAAHLPVPGEPRAGRGARGRGGSGRSAGPPAPPRSSGRWSRLSRPARGASSFSATSLTRPGRPRTSSWPPRPSAPGPPSSPCAPVPSRPGPAPRVRPDRPLPVACAPQCPRARVSPRAPPAPPGPSPAACAPRCPYGWVPPRAPPAPPPPVSPGAPRPGPAPAPPGPGRAPSAPGAPAPAFQALRACARGLPNQTRGATNSGPPGRPGLPPGCLKQRSHSGARPVRLVVAWEKEPCLLCQAFLVTKPGRPC
uniref:basic proline-rich protein-like n=1 Tax=Panthera onca TaxID=9690 RepID=UPI0029549340|nr:basic proline-rich protein-like [Panthera onca]